MGIRIINTNNNKVFLNKDISHNNPNNNKVFLNKDISHNNPNNNKVFLNKDISHNNPNINKVFLNKDISHNNPNINKISLTIKENYHNYHNNPNINKVVLNNIKTNIYNKDRIKDKTNYFNNLSRIQSRKYKSNQNNIKCNMIQHNRLYFILYLIKNFR